TAQINAVATDLRPAATKTGALGSAANVEAVAAAAGRHDLRPLVVDPVMIATSGDPLLAGHSVEALPHLLLPPATPVTPHLPQAPALLGGASLASQADVEAAARAIAALGPQAVLIKGGHGEGPDAADLLLADGACTWLRAPRVATR